MDNLRRTVLGVVLLASGVVSGSVRVARAAPEVVRKFGLIPSTPEELAAIEFANAPFSAGARLPRAVDLSSNMPPPLDQGSQGSCVAWAIAYALKSYQEKIEEGQPFVGPDGRLDQRRVFSPGFIYSQVNQGRDGGCKFPDAFKVILDYGAAPWAEMPYEEAKPFEKPSAARPRRGPSLPDRRVEAVEGVRREGDQGPARRRIPRGDRRPRGPGLQGSAPRGVGRQPRRRSRQPRDGGRRLRRRAQRLQGDQLVGAAVGRGRVRLDHLCALPGRRRRGLRRQGRAQRRDTRRRAALSRARPRAAGSRARSPSRRLPCRRASSRCRAPRPSSSRGRSRRRDGPDPSR